MLDVVFFVLSFESALASILDTRSISPEATASRAFSNHEEDATLQDRQYELILGITSCEVHGMGL